MNEKDIEELKRISSSLRAMNVKIKLLALLERAQQEYNNNHNNICMKMCQEVLATDADNADALRGIGCVMQSEGKNEKALEFYNKALKNSDKKEIEYTLIGTIYYNMGMLEEAIKYYNMAIDINDNYEPAYEGRNQSMLENHLKILDMQDTLIKREIQERFKTDF